MMDMVEHLKSRHLQLDRYSGIAWDEEVCTFPLWNLGGQMVGYQQYRPFADKLKSNDEKGRYHTRRTKTDGHPGNRTTDAIGVFGVETLASVSESGMLFLAEGIFDIVRVHNLNLPGIAVLGNDPQYLWNWLSIFPWTIITICDNDSAGKMLAKMGHVSLTTTEKDLGEMSDHEVETLLKDWL
jgi:hypothetical protein